MRTSNFLIATQKETPTDAEVISHQLMLRAGLIRKLASGLYTWLPLGLRVLRKVQAIVREEIAKGAEEIGIELWQHVDNVILAMRMIAPQIGLEGNLTPP